MEVLMNFIKKYLSPIVILGLCVIGLIGSPLPFIGYRLSASFIFVTVGVFYVFFEMPKTWAYLKSLRK